MTIRVYVYGLYNSSMQVLTQCLQISLYFQWEVIVIMLGCLIVTALSLYVLESKNPFYDHWKMETSVLHSPGKSVNSIPGSHNPNIATCQQLSDHMGVPKGLLKYKAPLYHNCREMKCGLQSLTGSMSAMFCLMLNEGTNQYQCAYLYSCFM